ncbi:MAG: ABC transporter substrate-binding protein [Chloroflexales bacterium]|nr:ABC transporter substrate-binding protein [Chloroflexales bacterium]
MTGPSVSKALLLLCAVVILLASCGARVPPSTAPVPVTVQLFWTHNAEFAGFYAAERQGYYADEGLAVALREGGTTIDYLTPISDGSAQFGHAGADELLVARAAGKPVRAVATIYRRSPSAFVALADTGITRPQDFVGKTIRVTPQSLTHFRAMMARVGIRPDQYTVVNLPSEVELFASGQADVWSVYTNNFLVALQQAGYKLNVIYPDDYSVHFYADSIFTSDDLIANNPDLVLRFLRATLKGWAYAIEHPTEIGPLVVQYAPAADAALETAKMMAALPLINTGEDQIGWMRPAVWDGMATTLHDQGVLAQPVEPTAAYTLQFLKAIYGQ